MSHARSVVCYPTMTRIADRCRLLEQGEFSLLGVIPLSA